MTFSEWWHDNKYYYNMDGKSWAKLAWNASRAEALEEAAKVAERQIVPNAYKGIALAVNMARQQIADAIRERIK